MNKSSFYFLMGIFFFTLSFAGGTLFVVETIDSTFIQTFKKATGLLIGSLMTGIGGLLLVVKNIRFAQNKNQEIKEPHEIEAEILKWHKDDEFSANHYSILENTVYFIRVTRDGFVFAERGYPYRGEILKFRITYLLENYFNKSLQQRELNAELEEYNNTDWYQDFIAQFQMELKKLKES